MRVSRRFLIGGSIAAATWSRPTMSGGEAALPAFSLPIGLPGDALGDGFVIRHAYATENTWYNPGWWHAGDDWYLLEGNTAAASVYAIADGDVVFAGSEYPGRVVIVRHADDLFSMYGHLDRNLAVSVGDAVVRGQVLGAVFDRTDGRAPSHLHFEIRTFLSTPEVNGAAPRYDVGCGYECPPGPGYWPITAPEHPSAMGWRNPAHVIAKRGFSGAAPDVMDVVVCRDAPESAALWSLPSDRAGAARLGDLALSTGERYRLLAVAAGQEASVRTGADAYRVWYRIAAPSGDAWVQATIPSSAETGSDGEPSSVRLVLVPAVRAG